MSIQSLNGTLGNLGSQVSLPTGNGTPVATSPTPQAVSETQGQGQGQTPSAQQMQEAAQAIQRAVPPQANSLEFSVAQDGGAAVIKVVDNATGQVIRQIPSEEVLQIAQSIEQFQGILGKVKA